MNKFTLLLAAGALAALGVVNSSQAADAASTPPAPQMAKEFSFQQSQQVHLKYLLYLPKGYEAKSEKKWPLIFFLHGAGERGTDVWKVAVHGPLKHVTPETDFPFIMVSPQCLEGRVWDNGPLLALLDDILRNYAVDTNRVYLTGLSMGGYGTWSLGLEHPERFAAIAPICGGGEWVRALLGSMDKPTAFKSLGIWAFHGGKDPVVPLAESQRMVDIVKKCGVQDVKLTVYPDAMHDSWTETYKNPELYEWFLKHERK